MNLKNIVVQPVTILMTIIFRVAKWSKEQFEEWKHPYEETLYDDDYEVEELEYRLRQERLTKETLEHVFTELYELSNNVWELVETLHDIKRSKYRKELFKSTVRKIEEALSIIQNGEVRVANSENLVEHW